MLVVLKVKLIVIAQLRPETRSEGAAPPSLAAPGPAAPPLLSGWLGLCGAASPWTPSREDRPAVAGTPREAPSGPKGAPRSWGASPSSRHSHRPQLFPEGSGRLP